MKLSEAIEIADRRTPNGYDTPDKVRWLLMLDQEIYNELILTREDSDGVTLPEGENDALLVPEPYAEDVYVNFLQARIAKENGENVKYNQAISLYNEGYLRYARYYCERHGQKRRCDFLRW